MLAKRIIPCLDVKNDAVVKGVKFRHHKIMGDIVELAEYYSASGADELVFYDITASGEKRRVQKQWINEIAEKINIPFCVAGGIRTVDDAKAILNAGADKISINSPALANPDLINEMVSTFGQQCMVIGMDSRWIDNDYYVCQYAGSEKTLSVTSRKTVDWVKEVQERGAGEIVLNCMDSDGVRQGYDIDQLSLIRSVTNVPLIASGGAGQLADFAKVFQSTKVDGALAASVFHEKQITINALKNYLATQNITIRTVGEDYVIA